jgi:hypothetical protein
VTVVRQQVAAVAAAVLVGVVVMAGSLVAVAAQPGGVVGLTRDGVSYLGAAANLSSGRGPTGAFTTGVDLFSPDEAVAFAGQVPFVQWPPLLPVLLAAPEALGDGPPGTSGRTWAGPLNALALGAVAALTTWVTARLAGGGAGVAAGVAAGLFVAAPADVAVVQLTVSSEPVFTLLVLGAVVAAVRRLRGGSTRWLVASLGLAGVASLTRFVGVTVLVTLALVLWWDDRRRAVGRSRHLAPVVGALAAVPVVAWSLWTASGAGGRTRPVAWHPPGADQWSSVGTTVWSWVASPGAPFGLRVVLALAGVAALTAAAWAWRRIWQGGGGADGRAWWTVVAAVVPVYLLAILVTHAVLDRVVPIGGRMLSPMLPLVAPLVAAGVVHTLRSTALSRPVRSSAAALTVALTAVAIVSASTTWRDLATRAPVDATAEVASPTGTWLRELPPDTLVVANDPALAWMSAPRQLVIDAPTREWVTAGQPNAAYDEHLAQLGVLLDEGGVVVLYNLPAALSPNYVTRDELTERLGLVVVAETGDGVVLARPDRAGTLAAGRP